MKELLKTARIIVCAGSGGVGKTTVASSLAFLAAQMGRRVLVLTVDPSQRLKSTMGLDEKDEAQIFHPQLLVNQGTLSAAVIDAKKIFDEFILKASGKEETARKILQNKLYIQLSTTLSGSQEFTALQRLYSAADSGKYDLIVLDTPPTKHAIDFLEAPQKLSHLFNEKVARWFRDLGGKQSGFLKNILSVGTKQVLKILESLTGSEFISELADFFQNIQQWQAKLEQRIGDVHKLLVSPGTHFVLVTSFDEAKLKEAEFFSKEIRKGGYQLSAVLINRAYPKGLDLEEKTTTTTALARTYRQYQALLSEKERAYQNFSIRMSSQGQVLRLPELMNNISDLDGVAEMAKNIEQADKA